MISEGYGQAYRVGYDSDRSISLLKGRYARLGSQSGSGSLGLGVGSASNNSETKTLC